MAHIGRCGIESTTEKNHYFDSYGIHPPLQMKKYLNGPIFYSTEKVQPQGAVVRGHLCLYVVKQLSLGRYLQEIVNELH